MSGFWARYTLCSQKPDIYRCIRIRQAWILYRFSAFFSARKVTTVSGRLPAWCCMVVIFSCMFLELSSHAAWHAKYRCQVTTPHKVRVQHVTRPGLESIKLESSALEGTSLTAHVWFLPSPSRLSVELFFIDSSPVLLFRKGMSTVARWPKFMQYN